MKLCLILLAASGATWMASTWWMECRSAVVTPVLPDPASNTRWPTTLPTTATITTRRSWTCGGAAAAKPCCPTTEAWWPPLEPLFYWSLCWRSGCIDTTTKTVTQMWFLSISFKAVLVRYNFNFYAVDFKLYIQDCVPCFLQVIETIALDWWQNKKLFFVEIEIESSLYF